MSAQYETEASLVESFQARFTSTAAKQVRGDAGFAIISGALMGRLFAVYGNFRVPEMV